MPSSLLTVKNLAFFFVQLHVAGMHKLCTYKSYSPCAGAPIKRKEKDTQPSRCSVLPPALVQVATAKRKKRVEGRGFEEGSARPLVHLASSQVAAVWRVRRRHTIGATHTPCLGLRRYNGPPHTHAVTAEHPPLGLTHSLEARTRSHPWRPSGSGVR